MKPMNALSGIRPQGGGSTILHSAKPKGMPPVEAQDPKLAVLTELIAAMSKHLATKKNQDPQKAANNTSKLDPLSDDPSQNYNEAGSPEERAEQQGPALNGSDDAKSHFLDKTAAENKALNLHDGNFHEKATIGKAGHPFGKRK